MGRLVRSTGWTAAGLLAVLLVGAGWQVLAARADRAAALPLGGWCASAVRGSYLLCTGPRTATTVVLDAG